MIRKINPLRFVGIFILIAFAITYAMLSFAKNKSIDRAEVTMHARSNSDVRGNIIFSDTDKGVHLKGVITGLDPNSKHGFHIHQNGDCSAADASSAGGHFNPANKDHGSPVNKNHHRGDLGNITADKNGIARIDMNIDHLSLLPRSKKISILNRAVIIHKGEDDLKSQPSGNAGKRVACGIIGS